MVVVVVVIVGHRHDEISISQYPFFMLVFVYLLSLLSYGTGDKTATGMLQFRRRISIYLSVYLSVPVYIYVIPQGSAD